MGAEWTKLCRARDLRVEGDEVEVRFSDERHHWVRVAEQSETYAFSAFVARQSVVSSMPELSIAAWQRNRTTSLVGFRVDAEGRLVGEGWAPKAGVTADEFQLYLRTIARECDRFEHVLTGRDVE